MKEFLSRSIPLHWTLILLAFAAVALLSCGWVLGYGSGIEKYTDYVGKQATDTVKLVQQSHQIAAEERIVYRDRVRVIYEKGDTIIKEVTKYVTPEDDARCVVPDGFVRMLNDAAGDPDSR